MDTVRVFQVAGFKNSGKTTLIRTLIAEAASLGLRTATVKHHGHGGPPALPDPDTDSMKFFRDGAAASAVSGDGVIQLHMREAETGPLPLIRLAAAARPDLILVEGFKQAPFEKIVLVRSAEDWEQLKDLPDIRLAVTAGTDAPGAPEVVMREDTEAIRGWFGRWLKGGTGHVHL
ncbi:MULTISPECIES: molybdopterin-guanine dinucleotide biosynthesis protein B [Bhargavaea]|uniref:Molybdopterin-guanine dinucleotide biosynthesis protein B n=1 Tax=Bhargavaea changchunensis TaxID=2134037 RepID=A0ABW2NGX3_9BACL|nr:molybdopterin-guanine dinucleotide biosynthesis protein B [Bhargavaea sp. CC-171006]